MFKINYKSILLLLLISLDVYAVEPKSLNCPQRRNTSAFFANSDCIVNDLAEVFYHNFSVKLSEIKSNFVVKTVKQERRFSSNGKKQVCFLGSPAPKVAVDTGLKRVALISYSSKASSESKLEQKINFYGCERDEKLFFETVKTDNLKYALKSDEIFLGTRYWHLRENESDKAYKVSNDEKGDIIKIVSKIN